MNLSDEYRRIALIMVVGFVATLGVLYWRDHRAPSAAPPVAAGPPAPQGVAPTPLRTAVAAMPATPPIERTSPVGAREHRPPPPTPSPPPDAATEAPEPVPKPPDLEFFVNAHLAKGRVRVRLYNHADTPIDGAVRIMRSDRLIGERRFEVGPNHQVTLGVDDGLEILSGDRVVVQPDSGSAVIEKDV